MFNKEFSKYAITLQGEEMEVVFAWEDGELFFVPYESETEDHYTAESFQRAYDEALQDVAEWLEEATNCCPRDSVASLGLWGMF